MTLPQAPEVDGLLRAYAAAVEHMRGLEAQAASFDASWRGHAAFRNVEAIPAAQQLVQQAIASALPLPQPSPGFTGRLRGSMDNQETALAFEPTPLTDILGRRDDAPATEAPAGQPEPEARAPAPTEAGETPEAALIRELKEELGIDTWKSCLAPLTFASHSYDDFHLLMPLFACRRWEGTPQGQEGQTLAWVRPNALKDYPMPPADIPLIPILRDWL